MSQRLLLQLVMLAFSAVEVAAQNPWHSPDQLGENQEFLEFAKECLEHSHWLEAYVFINVAGRVKHIEAVKDVDSGKIYFHRNGDMRWVVEADRLDSNLSVSLIEAYNGGSENFVFQNQLHSLGGYGLWRKHFDLLRFEGGEAGWQMLGVTGPKPLDRDVDRSMAHSHGGKVYVLEELMERRTYEEPQYRLLSLDVDEREWALVGVLDPRLGSLNGGLGFGRHWLLRNYARELILLDLESMKAAVLPNQSSRLVEFDLWNLSQAGRRTFVNQDSAWHEYNGERKTFILAPEDFIAAAQFDAVSEELTKDLTLSQDAQVDRSREVGTVPMSFYSSWLPWGLVAGLLMLLAWQRRRLGEKDGQSIHDEQESGAASRVSAITEKVMKKSGAQLETEELDELLGISHLSSPETLRSQRARMIHRINTEFRILQGQDLIVRKQSQEDRRRSVYVIHAWEQQT